MESNPVNARTIAFNARNAPPYRQRRRSTPAAGREEGYSLEIFNALGDTIAVITVGVPQIEPLTKDEVFTVRSRATSS
jgi:hypothetical protein